MDKKKDEGYMDFTGDVITGGTALGVGAGVIGKLPVSGAQAGVQAGLTTAGSFISPMVNIHAAGIVTKQLKDLKNLDKEESQGGFRL